MSLPSGPLLVRGKGRVAASLELPLPMEEVALPPSLEALLANLTLIKEPLLKDREEEVISELVFVYEKVVTKKVQDLLRDSKFSIMSLFYLFFFC